jgi:protein disulfide-isomerase
MKAAFLLPTFILALACANFLHAADWLTNYDQAIAQAQAMHRPILADFTGSDWCVWCMKLEHEVFSQPQFDAWASANVVLLKIDFPRQTPLDEAAQQMNDALAQKYNIQGFPTVVILKPDGSEKARTGYRQGGVAAYLKYLDGLLK